MLDGAHYRFTGVNAYELATQWGINAGCGSMLTDTQMDDFFASLRPNSLVRMWAWQGSMTTNFTTHQRDWRPLDRVVAAAARHGQRLILSLTSQGGECDDAHWKDRSWYSGGFRNAYDDDHTGRTPVPYLSYVDEIVTHLAGNPTIGMWEPVNEAEASDCPIGGDGPSCSGHQVCPDQASAATALRSFFDAVGAEIKRIDPVHLIESGLLGSGQCGTAGEFYESVSASLGIDVASMHDYSEDAAPLPGDQWNGEQVRVKQAAVLGKPIIVGELGIRAAALPGCQSVRTRNADVGAKLSGDLGAGVSGVLIWNWVPAAASGCTFDVAREDPVLDTLRQTAL